MSVTKLWQTLGTQAGSQAGGLQRLYPSPAAPEPIHMPDSARSTAAPSASPDATRQPAQPRDTTNVSRADAPHVRPCAIEDLPASLLTDLATAWAAAAKKPALQQSIKSAVSKDKVHVLSAHALEFESLNLPQRQEGLTLTRMPAACSPNRKRRRGRKTQATQAAQPKPQRSEAEPGSQAPALASGFLVPIRAYSA